MATTLSRAESGEYEAVRAIGAHFGWKGDAYGLALTGFRESDRSDKPDLLDIAVADEAIQGGRSEGHFGSLVGFHAEANRTYEHLSRAASLLASVSWGRPLGQDEGPRHRQAAATMDQYARGLLWKISDCTFIAGTDVMDFADDYDGLRAVLRVVRAGWATAAPDGLIVTDHGRDVARRMFVDR